MRTWITLALLLSAALAGCAGDDATTSGTTPQSTEDGQNETATSTGTTTAAPAPQDNGTSAPEPNTAPTANLTADVLNGTAPLNVTFTLEGSDADGDDLTWRLLLDGSELTAGEGLPATVVHNFTEIGNYTLLLEVSDGEDEVEASLNITVVEAVPEPVLEEFSCTADVGAVLVSGGAAGMNIGGCTLVDGIDGPRLIHENAPASGCNIQYDTDNNGQADGTAAEGQEHAAGTSFIAFCEVGVADAENRIALEVLE